MTDKIAVLDFGYVQLVETWGSEERIIEAARMSINKGFNGWGPGCRTCGCTQQLEGACFECGNLLMDKPGDEKLLAYLFKNHPDTPFEMAGLIVEVQAPIFVIREWVRHRTQSFNEMSARYAPLPDVNYVPTIERLKMLPDPKNKQAGPLEEVKTIGSAEELFQWKLKGHYQKSEEIYQRALITGVPKELARLVLPVGRYSRMRASANLRNWLGFLRLRQASNAQWEIQQYARAVGKMVEDKFPRTWALFQESM